MGWETSDRRGRLPKDWPAIRVRVKRRDKGLCQEISPDTGLICGEPGTDVDHINPGDDHSMSNLQLLCGWHHERKTIRERPKRRPQASRKRAPERHPGLL
jgi:5-methylcytosine-specific restriction enzyme A